MSFASGFVTGLAKSVDDQLKNDMLRTQKRMDGMEQYRVTRGRADRERKQKEQNEVAELLQKFASSYTNGDLDYAEQIFLTAGGNIKDASDYYDVLKKNEAVSKNFKIENHVTFGERVRGKDTTAAQIAENYIRGVTTDYKDKESVKGVGLMSLFDRGNFDKQVDSQVGKQVSTTPNAFGLVKREPNQRATFDHSGTIAYKENEKNNRRKYGSNYVEDLISLEEEYSYETDNTKKKDLNAKIKKRRADIITEAAGKNKDSKTSFFSKPNRDTIVKSAISSTMRKYEKKGIDGTITIALEGNEVDIFNSKDTAIRNLVKTWSPAGDAFLNQDITNEQTILNNEIKAYKLDNYADKNKRTEKFVDVTNMADALAKTKPTVVNGKVTREAEIKKGQMVINPEGVIKLWNGEEWI